MDASRQPLPPEIEAAVAREHGGPIAISGDHGNYVVMNVDLYSNQMASCTDMELKDSIAALKRSIAQFEAGECREADAFFDELKQKHEG